MHGGRFSRLSLHDHEARSGAFLCPFAVLGAALVLQISGRPKEASDRSGAATATPKGRKKSATGVDAPTNRRVAQRAVAGGEATRRAGMDAAARRRRHGTFLQQRIAIERTGRPRRGRCRSLHRVGPRFWERPERTRLPNWLAGTGSDP